MINASFRFMTVGCVMIAVNAISAGAEELRRSFNQRDFGFDPHFATSAVEHEILGELFIGLMTEGPDGEAVLGVAERHEIQDEGLTHVFRLRAGLKWSDGAPFTADDVVFSIRRALDPKTNAPYASLGDPILNARAVRNGEKPLQDLGVDAPDDRTVVLRLENRTPYMLELLTNFVFYPVPKHQIETHGANWADASKIVSNGAFRLAELRPDGGLVLAKSQTFYASQDVRLDRVVYVPNDDMESIVADTLSGQVHLAPDVPNEFRDMVLKLSPDFLSEHPNLTLNYVVYNTRQAPFDDVRVRRAISLLTPRKDLVRVILGNVGAPARSLVPPRVANYPNAPEVREIPRETAIQRAASLLNEAGYDDGNALRFNYQYADQAGSRRLAVALLALWRRAGVRALPTPLELGAHYDSLNTGAFQAANAGWQADFNDPLSFLSLVSKSSGDSINHSGWSDVEFETALRDANAAADLVTRARHLARAETIALEAAPLMPVYVGVRRVIVRPEVDGFIPNVKALNRSRYLSLHGPT